MTPLTSAEAIALNARLYVVARAVCTWGGLAEDVSQGATVVALEKGLRLPLPFVTLKHLCIDQLRVLERQEGEQFPDDTEGTVAARVEVHDPASEQVTALMAQVTLSQLQTRLLYLRYYLGRSYRDIACEVGLSASDVAEMIEAILDQLRLAAEGQEFADAE
jgi:DNA-directed RNA polymerase specialized sigma24 family protein